MKDPTIQELVQLQANLGVTTHLAYIGSERFVLAHTDAERASGEPLEDCPVHQELTDWGEEMELGYYEETNEGWMIFDV